MHTIQETVEIRIRELYGDIEKIGTFTAKSTYTTHCRRSHLLPFHVGTVDIIPGNPRTVVVFEDKKLGMDAFVFPADNIPLYQLEAAAQILIDSSCARNCKEGRDCIFTRVE